MPYPEEIDTSLDYLSWTNTETVTFFVRTNGVLATVGVPVLNTKRFAIKKDFLPADSALLKMDIRWRMAQIPLGSIVPKIDDVFQDGFGVRWVIKVADYLSHLNNYRLACLRLQGAA